MTARVGMSSLIATLRGFCNAGIADYTNGSTAYWSDDQLQTALDRYVTIVRDAPLNPKYTIEAGSVLSYKDYESDSRFLETTDGGTLRFIVKDSVGNIQGTTLWDADYERGLVRFATNTGGTIGYNITGFSYDVYAAAADIWYQKAAHASEMIDFSTDNHSVKRAHISAAALKMAQRYENMATTQVNTSPTIERGDMNIYGYIMEREHD